MAKGDISSLALRDKRVERAARRAGQRGLCQSHRVNGNRNVLPCICSAFLGSSYLGRMSLIRGLVSRTNGEGAEVQSAASEPVCVYVEMHLCVNVVLPEGGRPLILAQVEGSRVGAEEGSDQQSQ